MAVTTKQDLPVAAQAGKSFVTILTEVASRIGAMVTVEPSLALGGQITFKNGKTAFFWRKFFDINPLASVEVGRDKHTARFFLKKFGFNVPDEVAIVSSEQFKKPPGAGYVVDGAAFARRVGYPVIVKPNSLTRGILVIKVYTDAELEAAARRVFAVDEVALVQRFYPLNDYRIVVLDGEVMNAYQRIPLTVVGDGAATVRELIARRQDEIIQRKQDVAIEFGDFRIAMTLERQGMTMSSVPPPGMSLQLLDNSNISTGGESVDLSDRIAPEYRRIAIDLVRKMNLRLCGVDLMTADIGSYSDDHIILEINGAPGYMNVGEVKEAVVAETYLRVLRTIEQHDYFESR